MFLNDSMNEFAQYIENEFAKKLISRTKQNDRYRIEYFIFDRVTAIKVKDLVEEILEFQVEITYLNIDNEIFEINGLAYFYFNEINHRIAERGNSILRTLTKKRIPVFMISDSDGVIKINHLYCVGNKDSFGNEGWRDDLQCSFISAWEANIARILNFLEIGWSYEDRSFELKTHRSKAFVNNSMYYYSYTPDFILDDGSIIEVKGFWDMNSIEVASCFSKEFTHIRYYPIDIDIYHSLEKIYSERIANWEYTKSNIKKLTIPIVGITIPERRVFVAKMKSGNTLILKREPDNQYDQNAIKVSDEFENHLGYVGKDWASFLSLKMDIGIKYSAVVNTIEDKVLKADIIVENIADRFVYPFLIEPT